GYPTSLLTSVAEVLLREVKQEGAFTRRTRDRTTRPVIVPYIHNLSHKLNKLANRVNVDVVFSAPNKLASLCKKVNGTSSRPVGCIKNHQTKFVSCNEGVIYSFPLTCGKRYIGQTGRRPSRRRCRHHHERPSWPVPRARVPSAISRRPSSQLAAHQTGGSLFSPIVGGLSLELSVRLCRSTCSASDADIVRVGGPRMPTADTANVFKMGPEGGGTRAPNFKGAVLAKEGTENESPGGGVRLSTRWGLTKPHTLAPLKPRPGRHDGQKWRLRR
ncbi:hypothetical protein HPB47_019675, partial [Ixodes persulcatus]